MLISKIKNNINNKIKNMKKSQILLFGSLLIFVGFVALSWNSLLSLKDELYSDMFISFSDNANQVEEISAPISNEVVSVDNKEKKKKKNKNTYTYKPIDYSQYLGVLRIPKINLKRGFFDTKSKYNNIQ